MFHHSLEHMQNHVDVLRFARSKLNSRGSACAYPRRELGLGALRKKLGNNRMLPGIS